MERERLEKVKALVELALRAANVKSVEVKIDECDDPPFIDASGILLVPQEVETRSITGPRKLWGWELQRVVHSPGSWDDPPSWDAEPFYRTTGDADAAKRVALQFVEAMIEDALMAQAEAEWAEWHERSCEEFDDEESGLPPQDADPTVADYVSDLAFDAWRERGYR